MMKDVKGGSLLCFLEAIEEPGTCQQVSAKNLKSIPVLPHCLLQESVQHIFLSKTAINLKADLESPEQSSLSKGLVNG